MSKLPNGWDKSTLRCLVAHDGLFSDGDWVESKDQDPKGSIRLLQLADIGDGVFFNRSQRFINETNFEELRCTELYEGDILVARMPNPLGRACLMPALSQRCITVVDVAVIRPGSNSVSSQWLKHFLNSPAIRQEIDLLSSGTTRRRISRKNLSQLNVPVPPINEQKRIADKLDALLTRVDACRERLDRIPPILKRFRQAVLAAATSGELTEEWRAKNRTSDLNNQINVGLTRFDFADANYFGDYKFPASWRAARLDDIAEIVGGITKDSKKQDPADEELPYLRVANVQRGFLDLSEIKTIRVPRRRVEELLLKKGDILFNEGGDIDKLGRGWVWDGEIERCTFQNHVFRVRLRNEFFEPKFFSWYGNLRGFDYFLSVGKQTTNLASINKTLLSALPIVIPPAEEQSEIVRRCEALFAYADRLEARYQSARTQVERLTPALLAKAFRGELVPQDPNDEPASVLLERIRAERAAQPAKPKISQAYRKQTMTKMTEESVKEVIRQLPKDKFSFDELREHFPGDYDSLKDILFALLSEAEPSLTQIFNREERTMCFVRAGK